MHRELICLDDGAQPERLSLDEPLTIGRDPHCDLRLLGEAGSRFHARVEAVDGSVRVVDLGSRNGTWLDGERIDQAPLAPGQLLRCGDSRFALAPDDEASQALSDTGQPLPATVERAGRQPPVLPAEQLDRLLRGLAGLAPAQRLRAICRCAAGLLDGRAALLRSGALLAGELPGRLARRLAGGRRPRLLRLGDELTGATVADAAIGSAVVAPIDEDCHLVVVRYLDAEAFVDRDLERLAALAIDVSPLLERRPAAAGHELHGSSQRMHDLRRRIERLATCDATVLITGPSGSGKELVARSLHRLGGRVDGPFVTVNCAAIAEGLFEAELFGSVKGAFTGAESERLGRLRAADGGTLFLDEIGELPASAQAKLLRVLQDSVVEPVGADQGVPVNLRLLTATNVDLQTAVYEGRFRADLMHRIDVLRIRTPALDEHREDLPELASHLLERAAARLELPTLPLSAAALTALQAQAWPGNIRQLGNALQRALVLATGDRIEAADLELDEPTPLPGAGKADTFPSLAELEARHIRAALHRAAGNKTRAAQLLGISRQTLHKKLTDMGL